MQEKHISTLTSLYLLLRLLHIVRHKPLVNNIGASLLRTDQSISFDQGSTQEKEPTRNGPDNYLSSSRHSETEGAQHDFTTPPATTSKAVDGRLMLRICHFMVFMVHEDFVVDMELRNLLTIKIVVCRIWSFKSFQLLCHQFMFYSLLTSDFNFCAYTGKLYCPICCVVTINW